MVSSPTEPIFLSVNPGDYVLVEDDHQKDSTNQIDSWIGIVISVFGSARQPSINSLFQIANIDTGSIKMINADSVKFIFTKP